MRPLISLLLLALVAGCSPQTVAELPSTTSIPTTSTTSTTSTTIVDEGTSTLADAVVALGSAIYDPAALPPQTPTPIALSVDGVPVDSAPVIPVGVDANGEMEIPGAHEVGWYRFGPTPAQAGSSVLAAHIAWNGQNGVFGRLAEVEIGSLITVEYDDGSVSHHVVTEIAQYAKADLPFDRVFSKTGPRTLTLITCGGAFNRSLNSYDDNVVVYAAPLD